MNSFVKNFIVTVVTFLSVDAAFAQTTLPAGSDVAGDFGVGTSSVKGGVTVTGQTGSSASPGIHVTGDGGVLFEGVFGTGKLPAAGVGTRFMWYPKKAAFVGGHIEESYLTGDSFIGDYSFSFGHDVYASGEGAAAFGAYTSAVGFGSFATGALSVAVGSWSFALGPVSSAIGYSSFAGGGAIAYEGGFAYGSSAAAVGGESVAFGNLCSSHGIGSVVFGGSSMSFGDYSMAVGFSVTAQARSSFVIGEFNAIEGDPENALPSDPVFVIGNGTGVYTDPAEVQNRNAFLIRRNGDVEMTAKVRLPKQGDIVMGEFGTVGSGD